MKDIKFTPDWIVSGGLVAVLIFGVWHGASAELLTAIGGGLTGYLSKTGSDITGSKPAAPPNSQQVPAEAVRSITEAAVRSATKTALQKAGVSGPLLDELLAEAVANAVTKK